MNKKRMFSAFFIIVYVTSMMGVALPAQAESRVIDVYSGQSIQDAVDSASEGAMIKVHEGWYYRSITINKQVTLLGFDAKISGMVGPNPWTVRIAANGVRISGFTIQNAAGAGINLAPGVTDCRISDCIIIDNTNGITLNGLPSSPVTGVEIKNCYIRSWGTAIQASYSSDISVVGNRILAFNPPTQTWSFGMTCFRSTNVRIVENTVYNSSDAVRITEGADISIKNNYLSAASNGISVWGTPSLRINGIVAEGNAIFAYRTKPADSKMGFYIIWANNVALRNNEVHVGSSTSPYNSGVMLLFGSENTIKGNSVSGDFQIGIGIYGSSTSGYDSVENTIVENVIVGGPRTTDVGIYFSPYTYENSAIGNSISGVSEAILDFGEQNIILP